MMVAYNSNVASAGTPNEHLFLTDSANPGKVNAKNVSITYAGISTGHLLVTFSENGSTYTSTTHRIGTTGNGATASSNTVQFSGVNLASVKVDASANGLTYSVLAWS